VADEYGFDEDEQEQQEQQEQEKASSLRAKLREASQRAADRDALATENQNLKQQIAVSAAGLTLNDTQLTALLAVHSGDLTPDGLKATAQSLGFIAAPPPPVDDPALAEHDRAASVSAGMDTPSASRDAEIDAQLNQAKTEAEYLAAYRASGRPIV
jgi:hypothetical protein